MNAFDYAPMDDAHGHGVPVKNTTYPTLVSSTVMAVTFDGGVLVASDRSVFTGKTHRMKNTTRHYKVNDRCVVVFSGDFADFQWLQNFLERKQLELQKGDRKQYLKPEMVHSCLTSLFYARRSKMNPLWNTIVVCGMQPVEFDAGNFEPFIGVVNMYGVAYKTKYVATDFGAFLLNQMLETRLKETPGGVLSHEQAVEVLKKAMEVSLYRNCKSGKNYDITKIDLDGVKFNTIGIAGDWRIAEEFKHGKY